MRRPLLSHYHVSKEGDRLTVTPPPYPPGAGRFFESLRPRESWAFSPGTAECIRDTSPEHRRVIEYVVSSVEIDHKVWTGTALETALGVTNRGKGVTDHLRIKGPGYSSKTVAALHCERLAPLRHSRSPASYPQQWNRIPGSSRPSCRAGIARRLRRSI